MLDSFLTRAADAYDLADLDYSEDVGRVLRRIYRRPEATRFNGVRTLLEPLLHLPMGVRQRARIHYWLGMAFLNARQGEMAAEHFDRALAIAGMLVDAPAFAELALQQAHLHHVFYSMRSAQDFAMDARDAFRAIDQVDVVAADEVSSHAIEFGLSLLWELASHAFYMGDYQTALEYVAEGRALARRARTIHRRQASLAWAAALSYHWLRRPLVALTHAHEALALYDEHRFGSPEEQARMAVFFAEVALAAALHLSAQEDGLEGTAAIHLYEEAGRRLEPALRELLLRNDSLGAARAYLVQARHSRHGDKPSDRFALYDELESFGVDTADHPLLCQVWTERGNDLRFLGKRSLAHACYYKALDAIRASDVVAMGVWARWALSQPDE